MVTDALNSLFLAIVDLIKFGKNIDLAFGCCNVRVFNKNLNVVFSDSFVEQIQDKDFESRLWHAGSHAVSHGRVSAEDRNMHARKIITVSREPVFKKGV